MNEKNREGWFSALLGSLGAGVVATDAQGAVLFMNPSAEKLTGWTAEESAGKRFADHFDFRTGDNLDKTDGPLIQALREEKNVELNDPTSMRTKKGREIFLAGCLAPIRDAHGVVSGAVLVFWDATERRREEEELRKAYGTLQSSVAQVAHAEKMAALGEFTAGVSHELNQPLNVTKIICQGILRDVARGTFSAEDAKNDLPEIVTQMNRMAEIIAQMRGWARAGDGGERQAGNLSNIAGEALRFVRQQYKNRQIGLTEILAENLPPVLCDKIQIEQMCLNLLHHARHAVESSGCGDKQIEIKSYLCPEGTHAVIEISDNGPGIPEEERAALFAPFMTVKAPGKGAGLGLSVSRKIAEDHGGRIEFEGRAGGGKTFRVFLPIIKS
jgi:PAS domain S-box-containing protein